MKVYCAFYESRLRVSLSQIFGMWYLTCCNLTYAVVVDRHEVLDDKSHSWPLTIAKNLRLIRKRVPQLWEELNPTIWNVECRVVHYCNYSISECWGFRVKRGGGRCDVRGISMPESWFCSDHIISLFVSALDSVISAPQGWRKRYCVYLTIATSELLLTLGWRCARLPHLLDPIYSLSHLSMYLT